MYPKKMKIRHSCGCEETVTLYGSYEEKIRQKVKFESVPCMECLDMILEGRFSKEGLPPLVGSEKQIEWATKIRNQYLSEFQKQEAELLATVQEESPIDLERAKKSLFERKAFFFGTKVQARYFIEHSNDIATQILLFTATFKKNHPALWDEDMEQL